MKVGFASNRRQHLMS